MNGINSFSVPFQTMNFGFPPFPIIFNSFTLITELNATKILKRVNILKKKLAPQMKTINRY
jgi:hypothetical protein